MVVEGTNTNVITTTFWYVIDYLAFSTPICFLIKEVEIPNIVQGILQKVIVQLKKFVQKNGFYIMDTKIKAYKVPKHQYGKKENVEVKIRASKIEHFYTQP